MSDEDLKAMLYLALEADITEEPKHPFTTTVPHDDMLVHVAKCPECDKKIRPNCDWMVDDKIAYLPVSFCPRCGTPIDWTGVLSEDELGELEEVQ